jgi:hypothetical protein
LNHVRFAEHWLNVINFHFDAAKSMANAAVPMARGEKLLNDDCTERHTRT